MITRRSNRWCMLIAMLLFALAANASYILIPMDPDQKNHLKAYGITYWVLTHDVEAYWLLNYRGGSFAFQYTKTFEKECLTRDVSFEVIADAQFQKIRLDISNPEINEEAIKLEVAPKIAVYTPDFNVRGERIQPWDDAVTMVLTYAEIPYEKIYDREVLEDKLAQYDWLHLHHEDFTGQFGKFYGAFRTAPWYIDNKMKAEKYAAGMGYQKVSEQKLDVSLKIRDYVIGGGFMFAMCSATDSFDIALASEGVDICEVMFDGDPSEKGYQQKLNYSNTFAFTDFVLERNPDIYEFSNIDTTRKRKVLKTEDYFELKEYSAKWDMVPSMLCQNHTLLVKGFMGQTTAFSRALIKPTIMIMGQNNANGEARYIHGVKGKGMYTFFGGHDPEDYQHRVGDPKTELDLHPNSPGYRLILNNVLFPAAKKKKQKT